MTITINLPDDALPALRAEAMAQGTTDADAALALLLRHLRPAPARERAVTAHVTSAADALTDAELSRRLDELADVVPPGTKPLSEYALSRESIYEGRGL